MEMDVHPTQIDNKRVGIFVGTGQKIGHFIGEMSWNHVIHVEKRQLSQLGKSSN